MWGLESHDMNHCNMFLERTVFDCNMYFFFVCNTYIIKIYSHVDSKYYDIFTWTSEVIVYYIFHYYIKN